MARITRQGSVGPPEVATLEALAARPEHQQIASMEREDRAAPRPMGQLEQLRAVVEAVEQNCIAVVMVPLDA